MKSPQGRSASALVIAIVFTAQAYAQRIPSYPSIAEPGRPGYSHSQQSLDVFHVGPFHSTKVDKTDPRQSSPPSLQKKLEDLRERYQAAKSDGDKKQIRASVEGALAEYFEEDLAHRKAELERMKKRADDAEDLLAKRAEAKDELIDLKLKEYTFAADGLELFSDGGAQTSAQAPLGSVRVPIVTQPGVAYVIREEGEQEPRDVAMKEVQDAARKLFVASSPESRSTAQDELRTALADYFDRDLAARRKELQEVRNGLRDMEARLAERSRRKDEIIGLKLQLFDNEAKGLEFFGSTDSSPRQSTFVPLDPGRYPAALPDGRDVRSPRAK